MAPQVVALSSYMLSFVTGAHDLLNEATLASEDVVRLDNHHKRLVSELAGIDEEYAKCWTAFLEGFWQGPGRSLRDQQKQTVADDAARILKPFVEAANTALGRPWTAPVFSGEVDLALLEAWSQGRPDEARDLTTFAAAAGGRLVKQMSFALSLQSLIASCIAGKKYLATCTTWEPRKLTPPHVTVVKALRMHIQAMQQEVIGNA